MRAFAAKSNFPSALKINQKQLQIVVAPLFTSNAAFLTDAAR
ncbi:hypothetical protein J2W51_005098 [Tardiphaga robiniae]|nr:hypothetical protein [Tardiphaga robiniae]